MHIDNRKLLNALRFVLENGGQWYTMYLRLARWSRAGRNERVFARRQAEQVLAFRIEAVRLG